MNSITAIGVDRFQVTSKGETFEVCGTDAAGICKVFGVPRTAVKIKGGTIAEEQVITRHELRDLLKYLPSIKRGNFEQRFGDIDKLYGSQLFKACTICRNTVAEVLV